jgi:Flp pilus assembly protein TadG
MKSPFAFPSLLNFVRDRRANVIVLFAFILIPIVGLSSLAIDYGSALAKKAQLNSAADAAALAAINQAQADIIAGDTTTFATSDGIAQAQKVFASNAGAAFALLSAAPTITLTRTGQTFSSSVAYQGSMNTHFGKLFHVSAMNLSNTSNSSLTMGMYLSFYLLLDVSGSMGIPSTASEINRLAAINPDFLNLYPGGCTLSCHFTAYPACQDINGNTTYCQGFNLTRTGGNSQNTPVSFCQQPGTAACIQLRLDAVAYAVQQLLATAQETQTIPSQFAVGLYPFIAQMQTYQALTTSLSTVSAAAGNLTSLIDNGTPTGLGSGGTHFENVLPALNNVIASVGDGSGPSSYKPFVFMVTDGAQDNQYQLGNGNWSGSNSATTLNEANCTTLKNRGITLAVLYVPYVPIPNPTTIWNDEDGYANANIPNIPPSLKACASPGFFFTASTPTDITNAMQAMFAQSLQAARLTH